MSCLPDKMTKLAKVRRTLQISHCDVIMRCSFLRLLVTDCKFLHLMLENVATQRTDSLPSDPQDSVEMVKNNKEIGLQCSLNNGDMKDGESVLPKEEA